MAIPMAPIAGLALRYGAVALAAYAAARAMAPGRLDQGVEDAMDDTPEGVSFRKDRGQANGTARWVRSVRLGTAGPGVRIDATGFVRVKLSRLK